MEAIIDTNPNSGLIRTIERHGFSASRKIGFEEAVSSTYLDLSKGSNLVGRIWLCGPVGASEAFKMIDVYGNENMKRLTPLVESLSQNTSVALRYQFPLKEGERPVYGSNNHLVDDVRVDIDRT